MNAEVRGVSKVSNRSLPIIDHSPQPYAGPTRDEVIAMRRQYVSPGVITYYKDPMMVVEGYMQYVYDEKGTRYLDAFAGIVTVSVGHCHPAIVEKVKAQTGLLQHTTTIYPPDFAALCQEAGRENARRLIANVLYQQRKRSQRNGGSFGSRIYGNAPVVALRNGYHGGTSTTMG